MSRTSTVAISQTSVSPMMAEHSIDEKAGLLANYSKTFADDDNHHNGHYGGINSDAVSYVSSKAETVHNRATWAASVVYMALLVICGASMTLIVSFQDNKVYVPSVVASAASDCECIVNLVNTKLAIDLRHLGGVYPITGDAFTGQVGVCNFSPFTQNGVCSSSSTSVCETSELPGVSYGEYPSSFHVIDAEAINSAFTSDTSLDNTATVELSYGKSAAGFQSVVTFICTTSHDTRAEDGPVFVNSTNDVYYFEWPTEYACPVVKSDNLTQHGASGHAEMPGSFDMLMSVEAEDAYCKTHFHQPFIQLFQMGFGQIITGLGAPMFKSPLDVDGLPMLSPSFREFAPLAGLASLFDAFAEIFIILGLGSTYPSTAELMKATLCVFVGIASTRFFPGFSLSNRQWAAVAVMLCGAIIATCQPYIDTSDDQTLLGPGEFVIGSLMCLTAQIFYAMQFIVEEKLMDDCKVKNKHVNKGLLVFCEGVISITCAIILQVPFIAISSINHGHTLDEGFAQFSSDIKYYFQDPLLWALGLGLSVSVSGFDIFGLLTAEHMGSDLRAVVTASFQVLIVWIMSAFVFDLEAVSWVFGLGFGLIVPAGFFYVYSSKRKEGPRHGVHDHDGSKLVDPVS